jgi:hypothetical protein
VFLVETIETGEHFALKRIDVEFEEERREVINEIYLMQVTNCENVISYVETYDYDDRIWIVLE